MKIKIENKTIGDLDKEKKVFYKSVSKSKHLFRALNAWGMDNEVLESLSDDFTIQVNEKEEGIDFFTTAGFFKEKGKFFHFKGHRLQKFLPLKEFNTL